MTKRILCLKIAARGDLLLASPAFRRLRESQPEAHITLLVGRSCEDVARHLPYFDAIQLLDDAALFGPSIRGRIGVVLDLYRRMRAACLLGDTEILLLQRDWRYALIAWLARVPRRIGFITPRSARFLTHGCAVGEASHHVSDYLELVSLGDPSRQPPPDRPPSLAGGWNFLPGEEASGLAVAAGHGFDPEEGEWVALGFGGGNNVKTKTDLKAWPIESYLALATRLTAQGYRVVWLGDSRDASRLPDDFAGLSLAGKLTVTESAAVLGTCDRLVVNDTFLLHLGEALGVPTVAIFGPTNPACFGPLGARSITLWMGPERIPCSPCAQQGGSYIPACVYGHRCMRHINVQTVLDAVTSASPAERAIGR